VFEAAEDASASKYGGTGLGLPLSHKLCTLLGGRLDVSSAVGVGTHFTITLPASPRSSRSAADALAA
jgi:signal transduction histidine kinase